MWFRKKTEHASTGKGPSPSKSQASTPKATEPKVSVRAAGGSDRPVRRAFPGPKQADVALRVAVERRAYAELIAHAKESLDVEVCGILAGQVGEDEEGFFVHVEAVVRGTAASQASTHVTFTQETWSAIHQVLERDYPKLRMIGWYHTHPGFGVEFSDMDIFIQKNFFSGPTQIALVTDPLSGETAICLNRDQRIEYLERFWVDGREQLCRVPKKAGAQRTPIPTANADLASEPSDAVQVLETRLNQVLQAFDEQRASFQRFLTLVGVVFCTGVIATVGYFIYSQFISRTEPPKLNSYVPVPVQVGDKVVVIGVAVVDWQVPPELNAIQLQMEKLKQEAAEKAAKAVKPSSNGAAVSNETISNSVPGSTNPATPKHK